MDEQRTSGIATVMFTDVEASTDITTRLGDDAASALFAAHDRIVREQVAAHRGRDVRSTGDGFLIVFDSPRAAISCALAIQRELAEQEGVRVRIGLNAGEILEGGGDLFGAAINLAARVMDRAAGGEILVTDTVRQLAGTLDGAAFRDRGRVALKGFAERQRLYEVRAAEPRVERPRPPRRRRRLPALVGAMALAACAALVILLVHDSGPGSAAKAIHVAANSVAVIDPRTNAVVDAIGVGENPGPVAAGPGWLWVLNLDSQTISRIDLRTRRLLGTTGVGNTPGNLVTSPEEVWVDAGGCSNGGTPGTLLHLFTSTGGGIDLSGGDEQSLSGLVVAARDKVTPTITPRCGLAARGRSVWVATNVAPGVVRFDFNRTSAQSHVVWTRQLARAPDAIAIGFGSVWMIDSSSGLVLRADEKTGRTLKRLHVGGSPSAIAVDANAVWIADSDDNTVSRIDPQTDAVNATIEVGHDPVALAPGAGAIWVASGDAGSVARIDPRTKSVTATVAVGHHPQGIAVGGGRVWVTVRS